MTPAPDPECIREALSHIPPDDRDTWVRMAMAVRSELGDAGREVWETWSQGSDAYDAGDARDVWRSVRANGAVTAGTLYHLARAHGWQDTGARPQPSAEELAEQQRQAQECAAREQERIERRRAEAAAAARELWRTASPAQPDHPYLGRKGVAPTSTLRELDADTVASVTGYPPHSSGEPLTGRLLIVPVRVADGLSTCELIDGEGRKTALAGGRKAGGYWASEPLPEAGSAGLALLLGEGVATVLSAGEATGHPAVAALSAGNLPAVARAMRERYQAARLVVLADLVKATDEPNRHAVEAARAVGGFLAVPDFGHERQAGQTDFNDLRQAQGLDVVRHQIEAAIHDGHDGPAQPFLAPVCVSQAGGHGAPVAPHHTERSETTRPDNRHDRHHRHGHDADPLVEAAGAEDLAGAIADIESAIARCAEDPGALGTERFQAAARLVRERSAEAWYRLRGRLKDAARAAGIRLGDIDRDTRPRAEDGLDDGTAADELVALVRSRAELWHAPDGTCYASLQDGPPATYRLDTQAWAQWASYAYYTDTASEGRPGRAASETAIRTARTVLTGIATHEGEERPVYLRVARHGEAYYLDLGTEDWSAVEIQATGWRIVSRPPVRFWRPGTLRPLPLPVAGGELSRLWRYANIPERDRLLVLAWQLDALRPETPFAVLELTGQQGTAKSSTQAKLRRCIDPNAVDLRSAPKSVEDLFVSAGANWITSLNNISHLSAPVQDALCSLATGGGFAGRTLYTNADETLIEAKRPVMINGIVPLVTAQDLTDRVIHIDLPELTEYRREVELDAAFEADYGHILGGLLDLMVATLAMLPKVHLDKPPRMADYAALGEAMLMAQGHPAGDFIDLYRTNRRDSIARSLEASPVACAIRRLVDEHVGHASTVWTGTVGALRVALERLRDGADAWPRSDKGLSDAIRRQRPALAQIGIQIDIGAKTMHGREVTIRRTHDGHDGDDGRSTTQVAERVCGAPQHDHPEPPGDPLSRPLRRFLPVQNAVGAVGTDDLLPGAPDVEVEL